MKKQDDNIPAGENPDPYEGIKRPKKKVYDDENDEQYEE
jgi:hypothetical protein